MLASELNMLNKINKHYPIEYDSQLETITQVRPNWSNDMNDKVKLNHSYKVQIGCDTQPNIDEGVSVGMKH